MRCWIYNRKKQLAVKYAQQAKKAANEAANQIIAAMEFRGMKSRMDNLGEIT